MGSIGCGWPEKAFTVNGFRDWKHATWNKGALSTYNNSYSHKQSVIVWGHFKAASSLGTVSEQLGSNRSEMVTKNRHYFKAILDVILTCCRQHIASCRHRDTADSLNRGKSSGDFITPFQVLLLIVCRGPQNALYTSHNIL